MERVRAGLCRKVAVAGFVGSLVAVMTVAIQPASAHGGSESKIDSFYPEYEIPDIEIEVFGHRMELSQLVDYQTMAEEDGVEVSDIIERYHWQRSFSSLVTELADGYPDDFAGAAVINGSSEGWIAFAGPPPPGVAARVAQLEKPVDLIGDRGFSQSALEQVLEDHYFSVLDHAQVVNAHGSFDLETGHVTITVELNDTLTLPERVAVEEDLRSSTVGGDEVTVDLVMDDVQSDLFSHYRGGAHAFMNGPGAWCTWGFNVVPTSGGGGHGLAIAHHCDSGTGTSTARYHAHGDGSSGTLTRVRSASKGQGDMAFYRTSGHLVDGARFYSNVGQTSVASRVERPFGGLRLCAYGRTSGRQCDNEVYRLGECSSGYCRLAMTHRNRLTGGDSGGPWFSGGTAYGITHGAKSHLGIQRGLFTPTSPNFVDGLQVRVRTG